jgi:hypothetical protein
MRTGLDETQNKLKAGKRVTERAVRAVTGPSFRLPNVGSGSANGAPFRRKKELSTSVFLGISRLCFVELLKPGIADDIGFAML